MTIRITVDGWPYAIEFSGTIDIDRPWESGETVIRKVTPETSVQAITLDEDELTRREAYWDRKRALKQEFDAAIYRMIR